MCTISVFFFFARQMFHAQTIDSMVKLQDAVEKLPETQRSGNQCPQPTILLGLSCVSGMIRRFVDFERKRLAGLSITFRSMTDGAKSTAPGAAKKKAGQILMLDVSCRINLKTWTTRNLCFLFVFRRRT